MLKAAISITQPASKYVLSTNIRKSRREISMSMASGSRPSSEAIISQMASVYSGRGQDGGAGLPVVERSECWRKGRRHSLSMTVSRSG